MSNKKNERAGGVIVNNGKIVLIKMSDTGAWGFPKGGVENGETTIEGAKREIFEETGIKNLELIKELGQLTRSRLDDPSRKITINMFLFHSNQSTLHCPEDDVEKAKWLSIDSVKEKLSHEADKQFFENIVKTAL